MKVMIEWSGEQSISTYSNVGRLEILGAGADSWARPLPPVEPKPGGVLYLNPSEFRAVLTTEEETEVVRQPEDQRAFAITR